MNKSNDVIYGINGPVVTLKNSRSFSMMEMVYVGEVGLIGEVIGITSEKTTIQVYEDTAGLKVGDIVVSDEARYHDADVTAFGYEYGQLPGCPAGFKADDKLIAAAEACIAELNLNAVRGLIVSGDAFINGSVGLAKIRHNFPQAIAVEMEATAIAHVCHNFNVPFVVVRAISDVADQQSHLSFDEFLAVAAKQSSLMVESLVQKLAHG